MRQRGRGLRCASADADVHGHGGHRDLRRCIGHRHRHTSSHNDEHRLRRGRDWTGALTVPGLEFDLTSPTLAGATNKTVRAKKGAKSARVTFKVTAQDGADGVVPVGCNPRSGSRFKIGRTRVTCSSTDSSANTAKASFTVTVRRT